MAEQNTPVRHGKWGREEYDGVFTFNYCSECHMRLPFGMDWTPDFCPHCGARMDGEQKWISCEERLPENGETVLACWWNIHCENMYNFDVMRFWKGRTAEEMKDAKIIRQCDEYGNNKKPYCWVAWGGMDVHFGQEVTLWMPLPEPPEEEDNVPGT